MDIPRLLDRWVLADLEPAELPGIAAALLDQGLNSQSLQQLASLAADFPSQRAGELFAEAASEVGWSMPDQPDAVEREVGRLVREMETGQLDPRRGAERLFSLCLNNWWIDDTAAFDIYGEVGAMIELNSDPGGSGFTLEEAAKRILEIAPDLIPVIRAVHKPRPKIDWSQYGI